MTPKPDIAPMRPADLETVLGWAAAEGWNPGLSDAAAFHAADPEGFFLARIAGTPVAAVSVVNHDAENAFLGLYLCLPDWRGRGIGLATWNRALAHAGGRSIGLDGVAEQEANYRASGFVRTGATLRHAGRWPAAHRSGIRGVEPGDLPALHALDTAATGHARPRFLDAWLAGDGVTRGTRVLGRGGAPAGFATWRTCGEGTKIGPVTAPDLDGALDLLADIAALRPEGPLIVDVPEQNRALRAALEAQGFVIGFATARMYRGTPPRPGPGQQAIGTMELG